MPYPNTFLIRLLVCVCLALCAAPARSAAPATQPFQTYTLDCTTPADPALQSRLETIDSTLRARFDMKDADTAVGLLDLRTNRLALLRPDREEYAASVPKVGILLAYFELHPEAATNLDPAVQHDLGLMAKQSSNEMAAKFSKELTLEKIQDVLNAYHFYDKDHGGGIWVGKHYGPSTQRIGSPVADNSHAATVRQLLRYFLLLEQGKLVSPEASKKMRDIFASPDLPHDNIKFVKALKDRPGLEIIRKWGTWQDWKHDAAVVTAPDRHYILVALTHHKQGDAYLESLATQIDDLLQSK